MTYLDDLQVIKKTLIETAKYANGLAIGLQNAAPPEDPPPSVQYLYDTNEQLQEKLKKIQQLIEELST